MLKILLVDDNRTALSYFANLISWETYGFELSATAVDGEAALIEFQRLRPEVVITDVQMPVMDGIELTRQINLIAPETVVVFLSSYEEFSYIRSAMNLNVYAYILKHETKEPDLAKKLLEIREMLQKRRREARYISEGNLSCLINEGTPVSPAASRLPFQYFPGCYQLAVIFQDHPLPVMERIFHLKSVIIRQGDLKSFFYQYREVEAALELEADSLLLLMRPLENFTDFLYEVREDFSHKYDHSLSIIVLAENVSIVECVKQYTEKRELLSHKYFYGPSSILYGDMLRSCSARTGAKASKELLSRKLSGSGTEEICREMDRLYRSAILEQNYDTMENMLEMYTEALLPYHRKLLDPSGHRLFEVYDEHSLFSWYDIPSAFTWLKDRYGTLARLRYENDRHQYSELTQKTILCVYQNYQNCDLSAEDIARDLNTNVNKLNLLLKKELSSTVWQLMIKIRMEKARDLLDHTDLKIAEISQKTGYRTISHFSSVFKKYYGISPQEYRKKEQP